MIAFRLVAILFCLGRVSDILIAMGLHVVRKTFGSKKSTSEDRYQGNFLDRACDHLVFSYFGNDSTGISWNRASGILSTASAFHKSRNRSPGVYATQLLTLHIIFYIVRIAL